MRRVGTASAPPRVWRCVSLHVAQSAAQPRISRDDLADLYVVSVTARIHHAFGGRVGRDADTAPPTDCHIQTVFVVDDQAQADTYQVLQQIVTPWSEHPVYQLCDDLQQAQRPGRG